MKANRQKPAEGLTQYLCMLNSSLGGWVIGERLPIEGYLSYVQARMSMKQGNIAKIVQSTKRTKGSGFCVVYTATRVQPLKARVMGYTILQTCERRSKLKKLLIESKERGLNEMGERWN